LLLRAEDVRQLLHGKEREIVGAIRSAYEAHANGRTELPNSVFLHPPDRQDRRIIALPAWLGAEPPTAGVKWIASFPHNHERGLDRASAVVILNSPETGVPEAVIEGSLISARRTAASAGLAALVLADGQTIRGIGVVGCGPINFEIVRFLTALFPEIETLSVLDLNAGHVERFLDKCALAFPQLTPRRPSSLEALCRETPLISFATTAGVPHVPESVTFPGGATVLHVSLRDLAPATILAVDNVVDDVDHVCRAGTSIHLTEQEVGHRRFIRTTLGDVLLGRSPARADADGVTVFSPFGLGILDLAVARLVTDAAVQARVGLNVESFLPRPWGTPREQTV
jgi:2,3-diaminopropionate biosynthesis protein SbnB